MVADSSRRPMFVAPPYECAKTRRNSALSSDVRHLANPSPLLVAMTGLVAISTTNYGVNASRRSGDEASNKFNGIPKDVLAEAVYLNGVPVYNYHKAYSAVSGIPLSSSPHANRREERIDWILVFPESYSDRHVREACDALPISATCLWKGTPDKGGAPALIARCTESDLESILRRHPDTVFVEPDQPMSVPPNEAEETDQSFDQSSAQLIPWGLDRINARRGLDGFYGVIGGEGVHVYVVDTGIRATHHDFGGRVIPTLDIVNGSMAECSSDDSGCAHDVHGHGTHCAGIVGGSASGVAKLATLHAVKVVFNNDTGSLKWILQALDYVAAKGERPAIMSVSLGGPEKGKIVAVKAFIDKVVAAGVPVVVAAGNDDDDACEWTAGFVDSAITVASSTRNDSRSNFSNQGPCVDIFAPGSLIRSASNADDSSFRISSGTSMACPHVAGAAALLMAENSSLTPADVKMALRERATHGVVSNIEPDTPNLLLYVPDYVRGKIRWATSPDKCLDVLGGNPRNGNNIALWDCIEGNPNQRFRVPGAGRFGEIKWAEHQNKCADVLGGNPRNGNNVALWDCIFENPNQEFQVPVYEPGQIKWGTKPDKCLDVHGGTVGGSNVGLWDCQEGNPNQIFIWNFSSGAW